VKPALPPSDTELVEAFVVAALAAGRVILDVRRQGAKVERKADATPVTEADRRAEAVIVERLVAIAPDVPVIAEEACAAGHLPHVSKEFFLIDPLDGTKEFVKGGDDFTVNIALIRDGVPVVGVVFAPACGALYAGLAGDGAWSAEAKEGKLGPRHAISIRAANGGPIAVVASKSHRTAATDIYIARYEVGDLVSAGSSLKFCLVAEGKADLYPRMGATMQWDTAAGDAVLRAAGGKVVTVDGTPLPYGPNGAPGVEAFRNPWFIAAGGIKLIA
jgi:3'(2'), 5'-bisphosphate nucleotidase